MDSWLGSGGGIRPLGARPCCCDAAFIDARMLDVAAAIDIDLGVWIGSGGGPPTDWLGPLVCTKSVCSGCGVMDSDGCDRKPGDLGANAWLEEAESDELISGWIRRPLTPLAAGIGGGARPGGGNLDCAGVVVPACASSLMGCNGGLACWLPSRLLLLVDGGGSGILGCGGGGGTMRDREIVRRCVKGGRAADASPLAEQE
jgi:hypothetical protein